MEENKEETQDFYHPVTFQDDICKVSESIESANVANTKIVAMVESKLLTLNMDKTICIVVGEKKARRKMIKELEKSPLILDSQPMKYAMGGKYLGDQLSSDLKESVSETVKKRVRLASSTSYEIITVVDDKRVEAVGSLSTAFLIYETTVVPMLLTNAETFISMSSKTLKELDKAQLRFLRLVLAIGTGCPIPFLYAFTGTKLMFWRVLERKLLFVWHVANLGSDTLARETY